MSGMREVHMDFLKWEWWGPKWPFAPDGYIANSVIRSWMRRRKPLQLERFDEDLSEEDDTMAYTFYWSDMEDTEEEEMSEEEEEEEEEEGKSDGTKKKKGGTKDEKIKTSVATTRTEPETEPEEDGLETAVLHTSGIQAEKSRQELVETPAETKRDSVCRATREVGGQEPLRDHEPRDQGPGEHRPAVLAEDALTAHRPPETCIEARPPQKLETYSPEGPRVRDQVFQLSKLMRLFHRENVPYRRSAPMASRELIDQVTSPRTTDIPLQHVRAASHRRVVHQLQMKHSREQWGSQFYHMVPLVSQHGFITSKPRGTTRYGVIQLNWTMVSEEIPRVQGISIKLKHRPG